MLRNAILLIEDRENILFIAIPDVSQDPCRLQFQVSNNAILVIRELQNLLDNGKNIGLLDDILDVRLGILARHFLPHLGHDGELLKALKR